MRLPDRHHGVACKTVSPALAGPTVASSSRQAGQTLSGRRRTSCALAAFERVLDEARA